MRKRVSLQLRYIEIYARGAAGEQAIAEAADILDDPTRARMREMLDARRADDAARNRRIETVSAVLAGRVPASGDGEGDGKPDGGGDSGAGDLRPGAPGWRQAVDDHYASLADPLETMAPDERARFEDDYARTTGVLPESGLLAAAHRQGAGMVKRYLDHQWRHNWTTNPKTFPKNKKDQFLSVETRLREFQNVPVWKPRGALPVFP